jgi:hypothetical protein
MRCKPAGCSTDRDYDESAARSAKTAAAMGRAPKPQDTAKIPKFDLDEALETSRDAAAGDPHEAPTVSPPPGVELDGPSHPTVEVDEAPLDPALAALLEGSSDDET